jgi:hypothetical protein
MMAIAQCTYGPHALGLRQGQNLVFWNDDKINQCPSWTGHPLKNPGNNVIIPPKQSYTQKGLKADKHPIRVTCHVRPWMRAWVRVFDHPYFAVTDADGGFEIPQAPAGVWRLVVWHETGYGPYGPAGTKITVTAGQTTRVAPQELQLPQAKR